jgi:hypothetical protein
VSFRHRAETRSRKGRVWDLVRGALALGILVGLAPTGTLASFKVSTVLNPAGFVTGALDLRLRDAATTVGPGGSFAHADLAPTGLVPGESVAVLVPVRNDGTAPFTWTATATATGGLASALKFSTYVGGTATNSTSALDVRTGSCSGTASTTNRTLSATASTVVSVQPALASGANVNVCVLMLLPATATGAADATAAITYTFAATQQVNP